MGGRQQPYDDRENLAQVREKVAGLDQRVTSVEASTQRELQILRGYFDEKFAGQKTALIEQKTDIKDYIDQKFAELEKNIAATPKVKVESAVPAKFWVATVVTGIVSAITFIVFVGWLIFT